MKTPNGKPPKTIFEEVFGFKNPLRFKHVGNDDVIYLPKGQTIENVPQPSGGQETPTEHSDRELD